MLRVEPLFVQEWPGDREAEWQRLLALSPKPSFQYEFEIVQAWARHLRGGWKPLMLKVFDGPRLAGILPLKFLDERRRGVLPYRRVRFLPGDATDFSTVLARAEDLPAVVNAALSWLFAGEFRWELLILDDLPGGHPAMSAIRAFFESRGIDFEERAGKYYYVDLDRSWEEVWASTSKKFVRRNVNLARNRLTGAGSWRCVHDPALTPADIVSKVSSIHPKRQAEIGRQSGLLDEEWRAFFEKVLACQSAQGRLHTHWLELEGVAIAYLIGFVEESVYYAWNMAFLPDYASYYPSRFLFADVIERCHGQGLKSFSFMRGEAEYKEKWAATFADNVRFTIRRTDHLYGKLVTLLEGPTRNARERAASALTC